MCYCLKIFASQGHIGTAVVKLPGEIKEYRSFKLVHLDGVVIGQILFTDFEIKLRHEIAQIFQIGFTFDINIVFGHFDRIIVLFGQFKNIFKSYNFV